MNKKLIIDILLSTELQKYDTVREQKKRILLGFYYCIVL